MNCYFFILQSGHSGHRTLLYGHAIRLKHKNSNMVSMAERKVLLHQIEKKGNSGFQKFDTKCHRRFY